MLIAIFPDWEIWEKIKRRYFTTKKVTKEDVERRFNYLEFGGIKNHFVDVNNMVKIA